MITRLEATRYRCFDRLDVELGEFQVLVGANGSGKTTLLDIPVLLGEMLRQRSIGAAFTERRQDQPPRAAALSELVFCGRGEDFILAVEARIPDSLIQEAARELGSGAVQRDQQPTQVRYEVRLEIFNDRDLQVKNEYLMLFPDQHSPVRGKVRLYGETAVRRSWKLILKREYGGSAVFRAESTKRTRASEADVEPTLLALPRVQFESRSEFRAARWFHDLLVYGTVFLDPDWESLRTASPTGLPFDVVPSGRNIPWLALRLRETEPDRFQAWVEHVRTALPQIKSVTVRQREDDRHAYFAVTYQGGYTVTSSGVSEGTLRILVLTLLPYLRSNPALILAEEPETGIHPRAIQAVLQSLSSLYGSQAWITSHSPIVLAHVDLDQILCSEIRKDGAVEVISGKDHPRLKDWRGEIDLGSLFAAGVLG